MFGLGMQELIIVGIVAVLLFGAKLPDVARSMGKSYREFRNGLSDVKSQVNINEVYDDNYGGSYGGSYETEDFDDRDEATAPRFDPPPSEEPVAQGSEAATSEATASEATASEATSDNDDEKNDYA